MENHRQKSLKCYSEYLCIILLILLPLVVQAQANTLAEKPLPADLSKPERAITIVDLYRQCEGIHQLMNQLTFAMGKKSKLHPQLIIENAQPRDVLLQSISIYNKANRLAFEYTRQTNPEMSTTDVNQTHLENIWNVLHQTLLIFYRLQPILDIKQPIKIDMPRTPITLTEVSKLLIELNQQIDDMGWTQASPAETFGALTKAIYLAAALLADSPEPQEIPDAPAFERGKTPEQVYRRLLTIMNMINLISERQHIPSMSIRVENLQAENIHPSDVNDMTYFIIARLESFYYLAHKKNKEIEIYYHGWKLPSHIFQRAGILEIQVQHLFDTIKNHPAWLKGAATHAEIQE
ncbi:MAG: hypothetical protein ACHQUC_03620 [Chlamydiales bacterium]